MMSCFRLTEVRRQYVFLSVITSKIHVNASVAVNFCRVSCTYVMTERWKYYRCLIHVSMLSVDVWVGYIIKELWTLLLVYTK